MIREAYVSFEVAKLLKEKGFDEYCRYFYDCDKPNTGYLSNKKYGEDVHNSKVYDGRNLAACPTHQMTMAWLREEHHIAINIGWGEVFEEQYQWWSIVLNMDNGNVLYDGDYCASYEKVAEQSIKYVLEHVI